MNREEESYRLFSCSFEDDHREQLAFPNHLIEASQTGGQKEISAFLSRLKVARNVIDRFPAFKASFGKQFHPLVLESACQYITISAATYLVQRLATAYSQALEQFETSSNKYPFATVKRDLDRVVIKLVAEAISVPQMVSAVHRIVGAGLELICWRCSGPLVPVNGLQVSL